MIASAFPVLVATFIIITAKEPAIKLVKSGRDKYLDIARKGVSSFLNHKALKSLALNGIFVYAGAYFLIWLYQPQLQKLGVAIIYFGFIRALFALSGVVFNHNLQLTEKLFGSSSKFFNLTTLMTVISLLLIAVFPSVATIILAIILIGGLGQARFTALNSYMNDQIPSERRATTLSTISMLNRIVLILLNPAVGFIADHSLRGAFLFVGALSLVALVFIPLRLPKASESPNNRS